MTETLLSVQTTFDTKIDSLERVYIDRNEELYQDNVKKFDEFANNFNILKDGIELLKATIDDEVSDKIKRSYDSFDEIIDSQNKKVSNDLDKFNSVFSEKITAYKLEFDNLKLDIAKINSNYDLLLEDKLQGIDGKINSFYNEKSTQFKEKVNGLVNSLEVIEREFEEKILLVNSNFTEKNQSMVEQSSEYLNAILGKFNDLSKEINNIKGNFEQQLAYDLQNSSAKLTEFEDTIKGEYDTNYKNLIDELKNLESVYINKNESLLSSNREYLNDFSSKITDISKEVESMKHSFKQELDMKMADSSQKIFGFENEINTKINNNFEKFLLKVKEIEDEVKFNSEELSYDNKKQFEGFNIQFESIKGDFVRLKEGFNIELQKMLASSDATLSGYQSDYNQKFDEALNSLTTKLGKLESDYINKNESLLSSNREYLNDFSSKMVDISKEVEEMKHSFEKKIDLKLVNSTEKLTTFEESLKNLYYSNYDKIVNQLKNFESEFIKNSKDVEQNSNRILENLTEQFEKISGEINILKSDIDGDISDKIAKGNEALDSIFKNGIDNLKESYREVENETIKKINDYRNEIFKIKQNITNLDEKFASVFDEKVDRFDEILNENIKGLNIRYQEDIGIVEKKLFDIETELQKNITNIEKDYIGRAEVMISKNREILDRFVNKFEDINANITSLKESIDNDLSQKIENGKNIIKEIFDREMDVARESFILSQSEYQSKIEEFKREMAKVSQNVKQIDDKFTAKFLEHTALLDKKIGGLEDSIKSIEKQSILFEKAGELKNRLTEDIKTLKDEITKIKGEREDIVEIEKKMIDIKNIFLTTLEKSNLINGEKKKIENISTIVNELKQVTNNVEEKIETVKGAKALLLNIEDKIEVVNKKASDIDGYIKLLKDKEDDIKESIDAMGQLQSINGELNSKFDTLHKKYDDLDFKRSVYEKGIKTFEKEASLITKSEAKLNDVLDKLIRWIR